MLYENELCRGCDLVLTADNDVVVCPVCGTPQHRACWKEHNACVNETLHAEGFIWKPSGSAAEESGSKSFNPSTDSGIICPVCGTNNPEGTDVCENCKTGFGAAAPEDNPANPVLQPGGLKLPFLAGVSPDEMIGEVKAVDIALYTQFGAKRYIDKFRKMEPPGKRLSWNWGAFIFSPYWFFYRKLYWLGGIFLGLTLVMAILFAGPSLEISKDYEKLMPVITKTNLTAADIEYLRAETAKYAGILYAFAGFGLLTHSTAALVANTAYKKKTVTDIKSIRRFSKDETTFRMLTIRRGGTSFIALMGSVLCYDLILYFVNFTVSQM